MEETEAPGTPEAPASPEGQAAPPAAPAAPAAAAPPAAPAAPAAVEPPSEPPKSFADMNLDPAIQQALDEMGFEVPMEVQTAIYARALAGRDLMVQSRTGSGKTAAFGIPIVQAVPPASTGVQALIVAPTRELALQISQELGRISAYRNVKVVPVYGGAPMGRQIEALKAGAQIVAGTPGRLLDHMRRGTLKTNGVRMLVLDECDEMLSMGFQEDIEKIISELPRERQMMLFSATIPEEIERIARRHMHGHEKVVLSADFVGVHQIRHEYFLVSGLSRTRDLLRVLEYEQPSAAIVFCNTRDDTAMVASFLRRHGFDAEAISSDLTQADRERVMALSREKKLKFLVATDIAARGIDISDLSHVINYTFPESPEIYIHRTGRTGRVGKSGTAVSLVGPREIGSLYYVKLLYKIKPVERELPSEIELKTRREAERFSQIQHEVSEDPGDEWRSLARRTWQSSEGERIVAAMLRRLVELPGGLAERPAPPPPPAPVAAPASGGGEGPGRAPGGERPRRDFERDRGDRGRGRDRDRGGRDRGRSEARGERGPARERAGEGDRGRGERGTGRPGDRDRRPRPPRPPEAAGVGAGEARGPAPAAAAAGPADDAATTQPRPGQEREFWEAWADEKTEHFERPAELEGGAGAPPPARAPRREEPPLEPGLVRLYVNVGRREGLKPEDVAGLLREAAPGAEVEAGRIAVHGTHSYVIVKEEAVDAVIGALGGRKVGERELVVERAKK